MAQIVPQGHRIQAGGRKFPVDGLGVHNEGGEPIVLGMQFRKLNSGTVKKSRRHNHHIRRRPAMDVLGG